MSGTSFITLVAALVAAVASTGNIYWAHLSQSSLEREKWETSRENERRTDLRDAVEAFSRELANGIWQANWLLWHARHVPSAFDETKIEAYEKEIQKVLPGLLVTRVILAAHDVCIYEDVTALANDFYNLDVRIGVASHRFLQQQSKLQGLKELGNLYQQALDFHELLGNQLAQILSDEASLNGPVKTDETNSDC